MSNLFCLQACVHTLLTISLHSQASASFELESSFWRDFEMLQSTIYNFQVSRPWIMHKLTAYTKSGLLSVDSINFSLISDMTFVNLDTLLFGAHTLFLHTLKGRKRRNKWKHMTHMLTLERKNQGETWAQILNHIYRTKDTCS